MQPEFIVKIPGYSIKQSSTLPEDFKDYYLHGSEFMFVSGTFGNICLQTVRLDTYLIYYAILSIKQDITISLYYPEPLCLCQILLQGSFEAVVQGMGKATFQQHRFSTLYNSYWSINCSFSGGSTYSMLVIGYPAAAIHPILLFYPRLEQFQNNLEKNQPAFLQHTDHPLSADLTELIYQLLQVPFIASTKRFHISNIQAIITEICRQLNFADVSEPYFSLSDIALIHATKAFIDAHLDTHYTIHQLARKMGINEHKLKKGFKAITGMGIFGYLLQQRLDIAKTQLEQTNKAINEIARKAGYSNSANFSMAFKKRYGITPYRFRKSKR